MFKSFRRKVDKFVCSRKKIAGITNSTDRKYEATLATKVSVKLKESFVSFVKLI